MNSSDKMFVWVAGLILLAITIVVSISMTDDIIEKQLAFKQGLCQTSQPGHTAWLWSTCPK